MMFDHVDESGCGRSTAKWGMTFSATAIYNVTTAEYMAFVLSTCNSMATADN
jgi:hypothetical protein